MGQKTDQIVVKEVKIYCLSYEKWRSIAFLVILDSDESEYRSSVAAERNISKPFGEKFEFSVRFMSFAMIVYIKQSLCTFVVLLYQISFAISLIGSGLRPTNSKRYQNILSA